MKRLTLAVTALFIGMSLSAQLRFGNSPTNESSDLEKNLQKLVMASVMINNFYVDSVDSKKLTEDAINGILSKLDPHSAYTNAKDTKKFTEPLEGSFEGIGVQFNMLEDTLLVIQPVPKGPSERVGILAGDRIVSVADTAIAGVKMSKEEIMHRLRGPKGTIAHLGVVRRGIKDTLRFDVKRDRIPVNSVDAAYMVTPNIGLIRFNNFAQTTHKEVVDAIKKLKDQGMKDLIIDIQQNSGGFYIWVLCDITSNYQHLVELTHLDWYRVKCLSQSLHPVNDSSVYRKTFRFEPCNAIHIIGNSLMRDIFTPQYIASQCIPDNH